MERSAEFDDPNGWFYHGGVYATCEYVQAARADDAADCRAACRAHASCNTVNHHEGEAICELLDCGLNRQPRTRTSGLEPLNSRLAK